MLGLTVLLGLGGVIAGAIGAHPPEGFLEDEEMRNGWRSAVYFLLFHVLVVLACADLAAASLGRFRLPVQLFIAGILLFSGSIFLLALGGPSWLGPVTPVGGLILMLGWAALFFQVVRAG